MDILYAATAAPGIVYELRRGLHDSFLVVRIVVNSEGYASECMARFGADEEDAARAYINRAVSEARRRRVLFAWTGTGEEARVRFA